MDKKVESDFQKNAIDKGMVRLTGAKFKYSSRMDKAVLTKEDYIEELEMRFEESADIWHLTCYQIYGRDGFLINISKLRNEVETLKKEIKKINDENKKS